MSIPFLFRRPLGVPMEHELQPRLQRGFPKVPVHVRGWQKCIIIQCQDRLGFRDDNLLHSRGCSWPGLQTMHLPNCSKRYLLFGCASLKSLLERWASFHLAAPKRLRRKENIGSHVHAWNSKMAVIFKSINAAWNIEYRVWQLPISTEPKWHDASFMISASVACAFLLYY